MLKDKCNHVVGFDLSKDVYEDGGYLILAKEIIKHKVGYLEKAFKYCPLCSKEIKDEDLL